MHPVDASLSTLVQQYERPCDIRTHRFLLVILTPVDIRTSRFPCSIDDNIGLLSIQCHRNRIAVCDIDWRSHCIGEKPEELLAHVALSTKDEDFHSTAYGSRERREPLVRWKTF